MESCNVAKPPSSIVPMVKDMDGTVFDESWEYPTIIDMLMYLSTNCRPIIAYDVYQCARFKNNPRESQAVTVKRILRYFKEPSDRGMDIHPT